MGRRSWDELDAILDEALDLPTEKRPVFFDRLELDPPERERLEKLIAAAESDDDTLAAGGALGGRRGQQIAALLEEEEPSGPPDSIPGYRLLRRIGSGGMGHVWEAEQIDPVRRRVAVKIIRPGRDTGRVVARFESERQTLALMNHPGIAQIFDAGVTGSGPPLLHHGVRRRPAPDGLLRRAPSAGSRAPALFVEVCDAVQHAHQKGVIHRDLKPSNVLVTRVDGRPVPKVIDFGIARLAEGVLERQTLLTEAGMLIGTPEYMSPEQAGASPADVDTRADVYALGVLLYELLAGALPFERPGSSPVALAGFFSELRETEPPRPSRRAEGLGRPGPRGGGVAGHRAHRARPEPARRPRLDRDEGAGEGPRSPLRIGGRAVGGPGTTPAARAGQCRTAGDDVPGGQVRSAAPRPSRRFGGGPAGLAGGPRGHRHRLRPGPPARRSGPAPRRPSPERSTRSSTRTSWRRWPRGARAAT